mmetsp:Transcript_14493/g.21134  ORF Transcript_14493/g.21134 Transcript_14493/m.21134 type:complete len:687 (+) Transcript_14493:915-2975(+)
MQSKESFICAGFGSCKYGQLGIEDTTYSEKPVLINLKEPVFAVSAGEGHSVILTENLSLFSLGRNTFGQLGLGHLEPVYAPSFVSSLRHKQIESVFCGSEHTFAISVEGEVYSWGLNLKGQLGLEDKEPRESPTLVETVSRGISKVLERNERVILGAGGGLHTLVLTDRNRVFSCGQGAFYALGNRSQDDLLSFQEVQQLKGMGKVDKLSAGLKHSAAVIQGNLYVWGSLGHSYEHPYQLVFEAQTPSLARSHSPRSGYVEEVGSGENFIAMVLKGQVWVLGEGLVNSPFEPKKVTTPSSVIYLSCGMKHIVCISDNYQVYFWGSQESGFSLLKAYETAIPVKVSCGSYHSLIISEHKPSEVFSGNKALANQVEMLKKEVEELKLKLRENELSRKNSNMYLERDPVRLVKTPKMSPCFEINFEELEILSEPIGRGGYGTVFLGKWRGTQVAVKRMRLDRNKDRYEEFIKECQAMISVRHPNIVLFMGACTKQPNLCLVLEYCGHGSLWDVLRNQSIPLPWYIRCKIALDTARGVNYLHKFPTPVLHRDLKSLNILLDDAMNAKIADFGWTRFKADTMTNKIGTYQWMAPEVILGEDYSEKADVYSFGVVLWELATRKPPYREMSGLKVSQEVVKNDLRPPIPRECKEPFKSLITSCWAREPSARPTFDEVINQLDSYLETFRETHS